MSLQFKGQDYSTDPQRIYDFDGTKVSSFIIEGENTGNIDWNTVNSFGEEWLRFNQFDAAEIERIGDEYFDILPKSLVNSNTKALDVGCGSGRWMQYIAPKIGFVEGIDPSEAVVAASAMLKNQPNTRIAKAGVDAIPFEDDSFDLVYSLGVLHHIPDTLDAMTKCVAKVKNGGYFLVYLYYSLDNRGFAFKTLFYLSNILRFIISKLPKTLKNFSCDVLTILLYYPFILLAKVVEKIPFLSKYTDAIPLAWYRNKSYMIVKNDSLDRFGTPLEQRFSKKEITLMMQKAGLINIVFSDKAPFWHAVGQKSKTNP
jgi:SAM-dependent methyltransferase